MASPMMKQVAGKGRLVLSHLAEHLKQGAVGAVSPIWEAPPRDAFPKELQHASSDDQQIRSSAQTPTMVFLGAPGAGKGTYSTRVAQHLGLTPIAAGDLVRAIMASGSKRGEKMKEVVNSGDLLPDSMILDVLKERLAEGQAAGERGVLLDGFPRTRAQAEALVQNADVRMAVNLRVREEILISKCLGRRFCEECGRNFNVADIYIPATGQDPEVNMPPLDPPPKCQAKMMRRGDDTLDTIKRRLEVYHAEATPVEEFFREQGTLVDFQINGGIPETLPRLLETVAPFASDVQPHVHMSKLSGVKVGDYSVAQQHNRPHIPQPQQRAHV